MSETRDGGQPLFRPLTGRQAVEREAELPRAEFDASVRRSLELGLTAAASIRDRSISLFVRGGDPPAFAGINTFLKAPYLEDARRIGDYDVAFIGVPLDTGTTYRSGARFGPQAMRRISALYLTYSFEMGVDLAEAISMADLGDVFVTGDLEKSFDQITRAVAHVRGQGAFPVVLGGDHSIGFATVRGIAACIDGNVGIIHFDRHIDTEEVHLEARMHTCPWFSATQLPNVRPQNLVQVGIGGWQVRRPGIRNARTMGTTVLTVEEVVEDLGIERAAEIILETAWKGCRAVYLSFDIDCIDPAYAPGTGWPEPGGFTPREVSKLLRLIAREGLAGMEVVEVSPPYDVSDVTALMAVRVVADTLGALVVAGHLPGRARPAGEGLAERATGGL